MSYPTWFQSATKQWFSFVGAVLLLIVADSAAGAIIARENANHSMAAGDFGIAFVDASGNIRVWKKQFGFAPAVEVAGAGASHVVAADIDGNGADELAYRNSGLWTYEFGGSPVNRGGTIVDLSATDFDDDTRDEILVANSAGDKYLWDPTAGYALINNTGNRGHRVFFGELDSGVAGTEFLSSYNGAANNARIIKNNNLNGVGLGGSNIRDMAVGNILNNGGENDVFLNNSTGQIYIWDNGFTNPSISNATLLVTGDLDGNGIDEGYWLDTTSNQIHQYIHGTGASLLNVFNNSNWSSIITADLDEDGRDELYGLKIGDYENLYFYVDGDERGFQNVLLPEPTTMILAGLGVCGLAWFLRRRRR